MQHIQVSQDIIPISDFKTNASKILNTLQHSSRTLVITQNGKASGVLINPQYFDHLCYSMYVKEKILQGLKDVQEGKLISSEELMAEFLD